MPKFEYAIAAYHTWDSIKLVRTGHDDRDLEPGMAYLRLLDLLGQEGWQLVKWKRSVLYFMREIVEQPISISGENV